MSCNHYVHAGALVLGDLNAQKALAGIADQILPVTSDDDAYDRWFSLFDSAVDRMIDLTLDEDELLEQLLTLPRYVQADLPSTEIVNQIGIKMERAHSSFESLFEMRWSDQFRTLAFQEDLAYTSFVSSLDQYKADRFARRLDSAALLCGFGDTCLFMEEHDLAESMFSRAIALSRADLSSEWHSRGVNGLRDARSRRQQWLAEDSIH